jgi:hypothetical protein
MRDIYSVGAGARGSVVVEALTKATNRRVAGSRPDEVDFF